MSLEYVKLQTFKVEWLARPLAIGADALSLTTSNLGNKFIDKTIWAIDVNYGIRNLSNGNNLFFQSIMTNFQSFSTYWPFGDHVRNKIVVLQEGLLISNEGTAPQLNIECSLGGANAVAMEADLIATIWFTEGSAGRIPPAELQTLLYGAAR